MDTLLKADIFFFVTTIIVIVLGILSIVVVGYAIGILRDAKKISGKVREEADEVLSDVAQFRAYIKEEGVTLQSIIRFFRWKKKKKNTE